MRPLARSDRQRWSQAVWAVEEYRDRYGIEDRERALGMRPEVGPQRADYDVTALTVERAIGRDRALERGVELRREQEQGLSLSR